jgi:hypothetical protein
MNTVRIASRAVTAVLIGLVFVVGLFAQTAQTPQKPAAAAESLEQIRAGIVLRAKYDGKIDECQALWDKATDNASTDLAEARAFAEAKALTPQHKR